MAILINNYLFLATPRTASNALFFSLRAAGGVDLGDHHDIPEVIPDGVRVVACVRNHFDWFVSSWIKATWRGDDPELQRMPFAQWLARIHEPASPLARFTFPGYVQIQPAGGDLYKPLWQRCDTLIRYEDLEQELPLVLDNSADAVELLRVNTTPHKRDYRLYYDTESRERVLRHYGSEMRELGYTFDNGRAWLPRDDAAPLTGGGLFDANNRRRQNLREFHHWPNQLNNPARPGTSTQ